MKATLTLEPSDFGRLLAKCHGYSEEGLSSRIKSQILATFRRQIDEQLSASLVKSVVDLYLPPNISARQILERQCLAVSRLEIAIDLKKGSQFEGFVGAPPLLEAGVAPPLIDTYCTNKRQIQGNPSNMKHKSLVTRERFTQRHFGILVPVGIMALSWSDVRTCLCPLHLLHPNMEDNSKRDYIRWLCGCCGSQFICECTRGVLEHIADWTPVARRHLKETSYRNGICHFCRDIPSTLTYIDPMYGGRIHQHYLPYIRSIAITQGVDDREAENIVRERLGIPRVGEGWVAETHLYYAVRALYPEYEIQREASPEWLGRQRFDIYLPLLQIAIEYQGQQHFQAVELFGGKDGHERAKQRDRVKREKAKANGVAIVEFKYDEDLTERKIQERIDKAIKRQLSRLDEARN